MSYASVAAHNAPPRDEQPRPDPALLTTETSTTSGVVDSSIHPHADAEPSHDGEKRPIEKKKSEPPLRAWQQITDRQVARGLVAIVNVGLIAGVGYSFYTKPALRTSTKAISSTVAAALALVLAEGYCYNRIEGHSAMRHARERRLWLVKYVQDNPYKGAIGLLNTAVAGGVGYVVYANRNVDWDPRTVVAIAAGVLALWGAQGQLLRRLQ